MKNFNNDQAIKNLYSEIEEKCAQHPKWVKVFKNCFSNTLNEALIEGDDGIFVLTGDIPAMWLRDSSAQIRPYIFLADKSDDIMKVILDVIRMQISFILHDPYANAFNKDGDYAGHYESDTTEMTPFIWERKYELDSLCYPMQLAYLLYKNTKETRHFTRDFYTAMKEVYRVIKIEQRHEESDYSFVRDTDRTWDTLLNDGKGVDCAYTGMSWSGFRPSDDHCEYNYLVPSNMFAVVVLNYMQEISREIYKDEDFSRNLAKLANEIDDGIREFAITKINGKKVYAYETDGLGNFNIMDDGNIPNLLSMPYLAYNGDEEIYKNTAKVIFSKTNPWYYEGKYARGIGSSHTWENYIWPLSIAMEGLVASDKETKAKVLDKLVECDGGSGFMHESFDVDDPSKYTREWFSWPNMLFCELVLSYLGYELDR